MAIIALLKWKWNYGPRLIADVLNRSETAMRQEHCFLAPELALKAEAMATRVALTG